MANGFIPEIVDPILTRFLAPIDCLKIPALVSQLAK